MKFNFTCLKTSHKKGEGPGGDIISAYDADLMIENEENERQWFVSEALAGIEFKNTRSPLFEPGESYEVTITKVESTKGESDEKENG